MPEKMPAKSGLHEGHLFNHARLSANEWLVRLLWAVPMCGQGRKLEF